MKQFLKERANNINDIQQTYLPYQIKYFQFFYPLLLSLSSKRNLFDRFIFRRLVNIRLE